MAFLSSSYIQSGRMGLPNTFAQRYLASPPNGPTRSDVTVTLLAAVDDGKSKLSLYVEVAGNYVAASKTGTPIDTTCSQINLPVAGFSVRSGSNWGTTNVVSEFRIDYSRADGWPQQFQVQVGAVGGGGTNNTVFVFSKGMGEDEA
jgi:hypothetical protein